MHERQLHLRRTHQAPGTAAVLFFFVTHHCRAADGAHRRHHKGFGVCRTSLGQYPHDFRNHVAGAPHHNRITDHEPQFRNMIRIVQRGVTHVDATHEHRFKPRHGRHASRAPHLHVDRLHHRQGFFGRVFMRTRPTRFPGNKAQTVLQFKVIHLVDDAVDFKGKRRTNFRHLPVKRGQRSRPRHAFSDVRHRKPQRLQFVQKFRL